MTIHDPSPVGFAAATVPARNARGEAQALVGSAYDARVLEPSPPAVLDEPWFADDPLWSGDSTGRALLAPGSGATTSWQSFLAEHPEHERWAADRWLGGYRRVPKPPPAFSAARAAVHRLAAYVLSPARQRANGQMALRWTLGGIGTPFFGADEQVRLEGDRLVRQRGASAWSVPVTSLGQAAGFVLDGPPETEWAIGLDVPPLGDSTASLSIDVDAVTFLADWYGFGYSVLEELRAGSAQSTRVQLWPEHFDAAFEWELAGGSVTFGASPGDGDHPQPYLYVLPPPSGHTPGAVWNADAFPGAELTLAELLDAPDQRHTALDFYRSRLARLRH